MENRTQTQVIGLLNVVVLIIIAVPIGVLRFCVDPVKRGFFCNDEDLSHPLLNSTVSSTMLCVVGLSLPIALIIVSNLTLVGSNNSSRPICNKEKAFKIFLTIIDQLFGVAVTVLLTDIAKYTIGRLR